MSIINTGVQILKGWSNLALESLDMLDPETKQMAVKRMQKCKGCPLKTKKEFCSNKKAVMNKGKEVRGCGCFIPAAAMVKEHKCPRGLWE